MRLKEVIIKNFRGYQQQKKVLIDPNITGITGRNDVGKSTILEALDIFFDGETSLEKDDFHIRGPEEPVEICCTFDNLPQEILLDETNRTTLQNEYLLDSENCLQILKRYKSSSPGKPEVFIVANHPTADSYNDLHTLKMPDLKKRAEIVGVAATEVTDARQSAAWRSAIWAKAADLSRAVQELKISDFSTDSKSIQAKLFSQLPLFALFKSDRESKDSDPLAKNPLQEAVKQAQAELRVEIERLQEQIQLKVLNRASRTLEKLKEMDASLAEQLNPRFKNTPKWTFDFTLDSETGVPINKRGSGVRRLILLNFFRAEAERRVEDRNAPAVIYAFEEPETSQHPSNQEMLMKALLEIGQRPTCQVLVTTHVPALAGLLPISGLRFIEWVGGEPAITFGTDQVFDRIAQSLGVVIDPRASRAKALVLVESPADVVFLRHAAEKLKQEGFLTHTLEEREIFCVPIGGCDLLKHWIAKRLADQFNIPWALLLDSDNGSVTQGKNLAQVQALRQAGKKAYVTRKREIENYVLPEVVIPHLTGGATTITWTDTCDAKQIISAATSKSKSEIIDTFWIRMNAEQIRRASKYQQADGVERCEIGEILTDFLTLVP